jgi:hypothetical protein
VRQSIVALYAATYSLWLLCAGLGHHPRFAAKRARWGRTLPRWNFFAPGPGMVDVLLLYRYSDEGGVLASWSCVPGTGGRGRFDVVWHPTLRLRRGVLDAVTALRYQCRSPSAAIRICPAYTALLSLAIDAASCDGLRGGKVHEVQFAVITMSTDASLGLCVLFVSELHQVQASASR